MVWVKTALFSQQHRKRSLCLSFKGTAAAPKLEKQCVCVCEKVVLVWILRSVWKMCLWGMWDALIYKWVSASRFTNCVYSDETSHAIVEKKKQSVWMVWIFPGMRTETVKKVDFLIVLLEQHQYKPLHVAWRVPSLTRCNLRVASLFCVLNMFTSRLSIISCSHVNFGRVSQKLRMKQFFFFVMNQHNDSLWEKALKMNHLCAQMNRTYVKIKQCCWDFNKYFNILFFLPVLALFSAYWQGGNFGKRILFDIQTSI